MIIDYLSQMTSRIRDKAGQSILLHSHRGIFEVWDGFFDRGVKPTSKEVKDLIALALVGGGMKDPDADRLVEALGPANLLRYYQIAQAVLSVAFMPDVFEDEKFKKSSQGRRPSRLDVRGLINNTVVAYYKPDEIRDMIPEDVFLVFDG